MSSLMKKFAAILVATAAVFAAFGIMLCIFSDARTIVVILAVTAAWLVSVAATAFSFYTVTKKATQDSENVCSAMKSFANGNLSARASEIDDAFGLAVSFNKAADTLEANEKKRREFTGKVAHDLRSPMTGISGFADGMLDGTVPREKFPQYLGVISAESKRLARLVTSMLDLTRITAGEKTYSFTDFDICELARVVLISLEDKISKKKLNVEFEAFAERCSVYADRDSIHQVLYNLCDNAVKYSSESGRLLISIYKAEGKIFVKVYNTGKGITKEELPHVFDSFYMGNEKRGLDRSGAGLGLAIVKGIIDGHREEIKVISNEDIDCAFIFTLSPSSKAETSDSPTDIGGESEGEAR